MRAVCCGLAFAFAFMVFTQAHHATYYSSPPDTATTTVTPTPR